MKVWKNRSIFPCVVGFPGTENMLDAVFLAELGEATLSVVGVELGSVVPEDLAWVSS